MDFFIDSARCTGCKTCELACKDYKNLTPDVSFRRIYEYAGGDWREDNGVWQKTSSPIPVHRLQPLRRPGLHKSVPQRRHASAMTALWW